MYGRPYARWVDAQRLLDGLDVAQLRAVTTPTQPLAILAGAGSGKTRVLTRRIAYRCATGDADPRHVLAVTFTRKAATELDGRLRTFGLRDLPAAGTFHALAFAQLRTAWTGDGTAPPKLIDSKGRFMRRILGNTRRVSVGELAAEIEWAKARMVSPDAYVDVVTRTGRPTPVDPERISEWYRTYEQDKRRRGVIDFDDLLMQCASRIERDPSFAAAQRWRFRHLFVDEYQDVNPLQERLLRAWLGDRPDLCVVGDPNQAIYGWNGADPDHLLRFTDHHPGAEVVELHDSYRSTPQVLAVAAAVLAEGRAGSRPLTAHRADGTVPIIVGYRSDTDEAQGIARAVRDHHQPGRPWSSQAVLVRTNAQTAAIETALRRAGVPYRVRGASRFLDEPEVKDLLTRLGRLREPLSTTVEDLAASVTRQRDDLYDQHDGAELPDTAVGRRLAAFDQIVELGRELLITDPHATSDSFPGWLRTVLLDDSPGGADAVTLASFHSAKGLEWDVVHIAGVEAGYVPISHAKTREARAEELRLFYVAITRSADVLRFTWAQRRTFGTDPVERRPSPLLEPVRAAIAPMRPDPNGPTVPTDVVEATRSSLDATRSDDEATVRAALANALRTWRTDQARKAGVRPTVVLSDKALMAIARRRPRSPEDLADLPGSGPLTRQRHGTRLLAIVAEHAPE